MLLGMLSLGGLGAIRAAEDMPTWTLEGGSGDWQDASNWSTVLPPANEAGASANLSGAWAEVTTITLQGYSPTLGTLHIGNTDSNALVAFRDPVSTTGASTAVLTFDNNGSNALLKSIHTGGDVAIGAMPYSSGPTRQPLDIALKDSLDIEHSGSDSGILTMHVDIYSADSDTHTITVTDNSSGGTVRFPAASNATAVNYSSIRDGDAGGKIAVRQASSQTILELLGNNTYSGGTEIGGGGTVVISEDGGLGDASGALRFTDAGGVLKLSSSTTTAFTMTREIVLDGEGTLDFSGVNVNKVKNINGVISGTGKLIIKGNGASSARVVNLRGDNTYSGGTVIDNVRVDASNNMRLGDTSGSLTLQNGGGLIIGSSSNAGSVVDRELILANGNGLLGARARSGTAWTWNGKVTGSGKLLKTFDTDIILTSSENDYSGGTEIQNGRLLFNNTSGSGAGTGDVTISATAGTGTGGSGSISGNLTTLGAASLQVGYGQDSGFDIGGSLTLGGTLSVNYGDVIGTLSIGGALDLNSNAVTFDLSGYEGGSVDLIRFATLADGDLSSFSVTGVDEEVYQLALNTQTGVLALQAIPEPSVYAALLALGGLAVAILRRKVRS